MLKIKEHFFDRFDQTFQLFKSNFLGLSIVLFLYNIIFIIITDFIILKFITSKIGAIKDLNNFDIINFISNPTFIISIIIGILLILIYLLLYIIIFLSILKSIKQGIEGREINIIKNIRYGFSNFLNSMKTYWYIFSYVQLIPLSIIIVGLLLTLSTISDIKISSSLGIGIIIFSFILLIIFNIYRGLKASFALYSAIEEKSFTKNNFNHSILITKNNWLRILGNILGIGLIIGITTSSIEGVINMKFFTISGGMGVLFEGLTKVLSGTDIETVKNIINEHIKNSSFMYTIIGDLLKSILNTIGSIFSIIFIYLFYVRLFRENEYNTKKIEKEITEL